MDISELEEVLVKQKQALKELVAACVLVGVEHGVELFLNSSKFEEEACIYAEEVGWTPPV